MKLYKLLDAWKNEKKQHRLFQNIIMPPSKENLWEDSDLNFEAGNTTTWRLQARALSASQNSMVKV